MKKRTRRKVTIPLPPRGLRPKLGPAQITDLSLLHWSNLNAIALGKADAGDAWQWANGALLWLRVAQILSRRQPAAYGPALASMERQVHAADAVLQRLARLGRVGFSGEEYVVAKEACDWMEALASAIDLPTAMAAAEWADALTRSHYGQPSPDGSTLSPSAAAERR